MALYRPLETKHTRTPTAQPLKRSWTHGPRHHPGHQATTPRRVTLRDQAERSWRGAEGPRGPPSWRVVASPPRRALAHSRGRFVVRSRHARHPLVRTLPSSLVQRPTRGSGQPVRSLGRQVHWLGGTAVAVTKSTYCQPQCPGTAMCGRAQVLCLSRRLCGSPGYSSYAKYMSGMQCKCRNAGCCTRSSYP